MSKIYKCEILIYINILTLIQGFENLLCSKQKYQKIKNSIHNNHLIFFSIESLGTKKYF